MAVQIIIRRTKELPTDKPQFGFSGTTNRQIIVRFFRSSVGPGKCVFPCVAVDLHFNEILVIACVRRVILIWLGYP